MQKALAGRTGGDTALKMKWRVRWFEVKNAAIAPAEQVQGIYLSAEDEGRGEERYVLVTENGTHQAIYLDYQAPGTSEANRARETFSQALRSLRAADDLNPGRTWIERALTSVQMPAPETFKAEARDPDETRRLIQTLSESQAQLISLLSVQPSMIDAYFLLGRTALMLYQLTQQGPGSGSLTALELAAVAKPLVASAYRFAQDVSPKDPKTTQLQGFWLETQKH
jgi:hypothetical protein